MSGSSDAASGAGNAADAYSSDIDMFDLLTDKNRYVAVQSAYLDPNETFMTTMTGAEELGRGFCYTVEIVLENVFTDFTRAVGEPATVAIKDEKDVTRYFNGIVEEITYLGMSDHRRNQYRLKLVSWLTYLKYRKNCRIFQNLTSRQIIEIIFKEHPKSLFDFSGVSGYLPQREFCVQFRESDFDFVSRLLEQDGIWYYFENYKSTHMMMLRNSPIDNPCDPPEISTNQNSFDVGHFKDDNFSVWNETARLTSYFCRLKDYNNIDPGADMNVIGRVATVNTDGYPTLSPKEDFAISPSPVKEDETQPGPSPQARESYEFPGRYDTRPDGEFYVKIKTQIEASRAYMVCVDGTTRQIRTGNTFRARNPYNITDVYAQPENDMMWRAVRVDIEVRGELQPPKAQIRHENQQKDNNFNRENRYRPIGQMAGPTEVDTRRPFFYQCSIQAIPAKTPFRSQMQTPRPYIRGPQTALIEGKPNTIYVDKFNRVKVKFFWDLEKHPPFESSCWIRVSQSMAGGLFGGLVIPRDKQEVVVQFIDGNPDWPIITGAVYNDARRPPEPLEPQSARSIFKTKSVAVGDARYNELRFDDTVDEEEVYLRAQHDHNVRVRNNHDIGASGRFSVSVSPAAATTDESPTLASKKTPGCYLELGAQRIALLVGGGGEPPNGLIITPEGVNIVGTTVGIFSNTELTLVAKPGLLMGSQPALTEAPPPEQEALQVIYESLQASPPII